MKRVSTLLLFTLFGCCLQSYGQDNRAAQIVSRLTAFARSHPVENAYLQFDKPYYAAGDTIYFEAYVTAGGQHKLSNISGVLHVDLVNTAGKIDQSIKLRLDSGLAPGDFALPDSLPQGNYRVRAYTQWMRNDGETGFFEKIIPVASLKPAKVPGTMVKPPALGLKPDIQFFPEGGSLIAGISNKIAFKAIGPDGLGIEVKGIIVDAGDNRVAAFTSRHLGMGCFYLTPVEGKIYSAKIDYPGGLKVLVDLPKTEMEGITLSLNNDSLPKATLTIAANDVYFKQNKGKLYTLLISSGGLVTTVSCKLDSPQTKLDILNRKLHTGVATITLFSAENEPLCERLFFVQNHDQLTLNVSGDQAVYGARGQVTLRLNALNRKGDAAEGHFSVSVTNEKLVPELDADPDNILSHTLLTSDLKGYIEQPNYYFADTDAIRQKNLDVLLLTQGYRRFEWKKVLDTAKTTPAYQPEKWLTISGRVDNLANKPVANGIINLIPAKGGGLSTTLTDDKGLFHFSGLSFTDTVHFVLNAVNGKGKSFTKITWFKDDKNRPLAGPVNWQPSKTMNDTSFIAYAGNEKKEQREIANYVNSKAVPLKQVNVHDKKPDDQYRTQNLGGAGHADQVMHADEIERIGGLLSTALDGRLRGIVLVHKSPVEVWPYLKISASGPMLLVIDGVYTNPPDINNIPVGMVETVEVLKYASTSIYGMFGGNGVLIITTKQSGQFKPEEIPSVGVLPINMMGFYKAREFYSPQYDAPAALNSKQHDLRSTIYWNPNIKTDQDGNARFDFYNADGKGKYKVTIEGIDHNGNIGRQVFSYQVQ